MRRFLAKEHETVVLSEDELAANEAKTSIIFNEVEELSHEIDRASDIAEALENMQVIMSGDEEPTARELALINVANQMAMAGDENKVVLVPAEESYYRRHTALEGIGEAIANVWKAIWSMISKLFSAIFSLFGGSNGGGIGGSGGGYAIVKAAESRVDKLIAKTKSYIEKGYTATERKVKVPPEDAKYFPEGTKPEETFTVLMEEFLSGGGNGVKAVLSLAEVVDSIPAISDNEKRLKTLIEASELLNEVRNGIRESINEVVKVGGYRYHKADNSIEVELPFGKKLVFSTYGKSTATESFALENEEVFNSIFGDTLSSVLKEAKDKDIIEDVEYTVLSEQASSGDSRKIAAANARLMRLFENNSRLSLRIVDSTNSFKTMSEIEVLPLEAVLDALEDVKFKIAEANKALKENEETFKKEAKKVEDISKRMFKLSENNPSAEEAQAYKVVGVHVKTMATILKFNLIDVVKYSLLSIKVLEAGAGLTLTAYGKPE